METELVTIEKNEYDFLKRLKSLVLEMYNSESSDAMDYYDIILEQCLELRTEIDTDFL